jgi:methylated-DNA-[protein]-cysteine S-methyltransferase
MKNPTQSAKRTTPFQESVYAAIQGIPAGFVTTYGSLATQLGCRYSQAIGQALRNNPFAPEVPCHRVVKSDGSLGGFFGDSTDCAQMRKRRLLEDEGIIFDPSGRIPERFILRTMKAVNPPPVPENFQPILAGGRQSEREVSPRER